MAFVRLGGGPDRRPTPRAGPRVGPRASPRGFLGIHRTVDAAGYGWPAAGATGYLLKDSPPDELLRGVRAAARGEAVLSPSVATRLLGQVRQPAREPLSQRELDILGLIAQGCSNREAAARLFISEATVKTHVLHIYAKLGVNDRAAAVAAGFERGLLPRP